MERLTERTTDGILVKEDYGKEVLKTLYSCYGGKPNPHYTNCEEGYCAMEKLATYEDAEEQGLPLRWIPCSEQIPEEPEENPLFDGKCLEVYLVTTKYGSSEQDKVYPFRAFWNGINFTDGMNILDVIPWMPLPKPYRESSKQTNADRIRDMSDEELAEFLAYNAYCEECYVEKDDSCCYPDGTCKQKHLEWLQSEAE